MAASDHDPEGFTKMIVIAMIALFLFVALVGWYFATVFSGQ
jgi:hypothetical protein